MADRDVADEARERRLVEDLRDQAHVLVDEDLPAVADRDAGRLLAAVLEGVQPEVGELRDVLARGPDAEHATGVLGALVLRVERQRQPSVAAPASDWPCDRSARGVRHGLSLGAGGAPPRFGTAVPGSGLAGWRGCDTPTSASSAGRTCTATARSATSCTSTTCRRRGSTCCATTTPRPTPNPGEGLVVVRTVVEYLRPIRLWPTPRCVVDTWVCDIRAASFTLAYELRDRGGCARPGDHRADAVRLRRPDGHGGSRPRSGRGWRRRPTSRRSSRRAPASVRGRGARRRTAARSRCASPTSTCSATSTTCGTSTTSTRRRSR